MITEAVRFNYQWLLKYEHFQFEAGCRDYTHHIILFDPNNEILKIELRRLKEDTASFVRLLQTNGLIKWVRWEDGAHPAFSFVDKADAMMFKLIYNAAK